MGALKLGGGGIACRFIYTVIATRHHGIKGRLPPAVLLLRPKMYHCEVAVSALLVNVSKAKSLVHNVCSQERMSRRRSVELV